MQTQQHLSSKFPIPTNLRKLVWAIKGLSSFRDLLMKLQADDDKKFPNSTYYINTWGNLINDLTNEKDPDITDLAECLDDAWNCNFINDLDHEFLTALLRGLKDHYQKQKINQNQ